MSLSPDQRVSRSNSDLCAIQLFVSDTSLSSMQRMKLLHDIAVSWYRATVFDNGAHPADRDLINRNHIGQPLRDLR